MESSKSHEHRRWKRQEGTKTHNGIDAEEGRTRNRNRLGRGGFRGFDRCVGGRKEEGKDGMSRETDMVEEDTKIPSNFSPEHFTWAWAWAWVQQNYGRLLTSVQATFCAGIVKGHFCFIYWDIYGTSKNNYRVPKEKSIRQCPNVNSVLE